MSKDLLAKKAWWNYLEEDLQELIHESLLLVKRVSEWEEQFHDYSFVVFPASKAYEGFLKKLFLDMGFISKDDYYGKRFRVGKALNPSLEQKFRERESVYDKIVNFCGGNELSDELWDTWKSCRNVLFHWFPDETNVIGYEDAKNKVNKVIRAMDLAFRECKLK